MRFVFSLTWMLLLAGCGHFQGPGEFKSGADYQAPESEKAGASSSQNEAVPVAESLPFDLEWPVNTIRITQYFQPPGNPHHKGIDIGGSRGMPIHAAHQGHVVYTGRRFKGYGNMVLIEYDNRWATLYAHLQRIKIKRGAKVAPGTLIGTMGRTGHATGVHLHFELMHDKSPIDPLQYLRAGQLVGLRQK